MSVCPLCDKQLIKCECGGEDLGARRKKAWDEFFMQDSLGRRYEVYRQSQST